MFSIICYIIGLFLVVIATHFRSWFTMGMGCLVGMIGVVPDFHNSVMNFDVNSQFAYGISMVLLAFCTLYCLAEWSEKE